MSRWDDVAGIRIPDSATAREAEDMCREASSAVLYAHALRSYFFAALLGREDGVAFDEELLYVACVLHDIGLTDDYGDRERSFEMVGADVAAALAEQHAWRLPRRYTLHRSIVLHMSPSISEAEVPEVLLVDAGVSCDVSGLRVSDISARALREVVRRYSRADFKREFSATLRREAAAKPTCAAALLFDRGLQRRIDEAPLPAS